MDKLVHLTLSNWFCLFSCGDATKNLFVSGLCWVVVWFLFLVWLLFWVVFGVGFGCFVGDLMGACVGLFSFWW